jgi:hypothetical protein
VMSVQLNQHQAVQSERSLEMAVLEGSCSWASISRSFSINRRRQ